MTGMLSRRIAAGAAGCLIVLGVAAQEGRPPPPPGFRPPPPHTPLGPIPPNLPLPPPVAPGVLGPFDRVNVSGMARVQLVQGERDEVTVVGDDAARRNVQLRVAGGRLTVSTHEGWKFWNREAVQVLVQVREITQLVISGASDIIAPRGIRADELRVHISGRGMVRLQDLQARVLRFDISGAGDGDVAGQVDELLLRVSGKGSLQADKLKARQGSVQISGIGSADVWVTDELRVGVSGIGTVSYWGQPALQRSSSGILELQPRGDKR